MFQIKIILRWKKIKTTFNKIPPPLDYRSDSGRCSYLFHKKLILIRRKTFQLIFSIFKFLELISRLLSEVGNQVYLSVSRCFKAGSMTWQLIRLEKRFNEFFTVKGFTEKWSKLPPFACHIIERVLYFSNLYQRLSSWYLASP